MSLDNFPPLSIKKIPKQSKNAIQISKSAIRIVRTTNKSNELFHSRTAPPHSRRLPAIDNHKCWYSILKGNNSRVLLITLRRRPWWSTINETHPESDLLWEMYKTPKRYKGRTFANTVLNHIENNSCLVSKKGLYKSIRAYCANQNIDILDIIPRTFYIKNNSTAY